MKKAPLNLLRLIIFLLVGALHLLLLFLVVFHFTPAEKVPEPPANVMKLADLEERPPPPPPPPPPERPPASVPPAAVTESLAEELIESDEVPAEEAYAEPSSPRPPAGQVSEGIDYLPQHQISVIPKFPEDKIRQMVVYPPIALRSGVEGRVFLELFIDPQGDIRQVRILREEPPGRGFGEAAAKAFRGIRADSPALANGIPVAVRYRYVLQFRIR
ncbi:MAG: TonB family protein [Treponema sp.]|jgi:protein TonB|nr:TonB family protein [Treponema sp.]